MNRPEAEIVLVPHPQDIEVLNPEDDGIPLLLAGGARGGDIVQIGGVGIGTELNCLVVAECHPGAGLGNAGGMHGVMRDVGGAGLLQKTDLKAACPRDSKLMNHPTMKSKCHIL